jgi:hypothetical protein
MGKTADAIEHLDALYVRLARAGNREVNVTPAWDLVEAHAGARERCFTERSLRSTSSVPPFRVARWRGCQRSRRRSAYVAYLFQRGVRSWFG